MLVLSLTIIIANFYGILAINRPVEKIVLTQNGFAQFIQYDIETPPIREFTVCTWIKLFSLKNDQTIFTYFVKDNNRVVRLWLDTGGKNVRVSINDEVTSVTPVGLNRDTWRHLCLSYQSDYGAWAIYLDAKLMSCYVSRKLLGLVLPPNGSFFIGYGTARDGKQYGFEGEIFGVNMLLKSTIPRNRTLALKPRYTQKPFRKNILKENNDPAIEYVVLKDMKTVQNKHIFDQFKDGLSSKKSFIKFTTPGSLIEHDIGLDLTLKTPKKASHSKDKEILDFKTFSKLPKIVNEPINFWNLMNEAKNLPNKFKELSGFELSGSSTQELPTISEFETPPPLASSIPDTSEKEISIQKLPVTESIYDTKTKTPATLPHTDVDPISQILEMETPPSREKDEKVYGQWSSGPKYANSVLDYLKTINFRQIPPTIPLKKSQNDEYPYPSEFKITKLKPPLEFQRNYLKQGRSKRQTKQREINVQILDDGLRDHILASHAGTKPKNIEITTRGESNTNPYNRFYRNVDVQTTEKNVEQTKSRPFTTENNNYKNHIFSNSTNEFNELVAKLPFLKSVEYYTDDSQFTGSKRIEASDDLYSKSLSRDVGNLRNVKPHRKIKANNSKVPIQFDGHKIINTPQDAVLEGRFLATQVSEQSNLQKENVSIFKYNHGYLPRHFQEKINESNNYKSNFEKSVKLGNALNERYTIGKSEAEKKQSFVGGLEKVPDINRYRSDLDKENNGVPPSLTSPICVNIGKNNRVLYVQPDGSIDVSYIFSDVKEKNDAIGFVVENYKICSMEDSVFLNNPMLFIEWNRTPVRLFGGAYANRTRDLCGFF